MGENLTLYDIAEQMLPILACEEWDEEQEQAIIEMELSLEKKAGGLIAYAEKLDAFADYAKKEEQRIADKRKAAQNRAENLRNLLGKVMRLLDRTEIDIGTKTAKFQKNPPAVVIDDESEIPAKFVTVQQVTKIDKAALKKALKEDNIDGAHLVQGERLVIK